jgi:hypothetical protein
VRGRHERRGRFEAGSRGGGAFERTDAQKEEAGDGGKGGPGSGGEQRFGGASEWAGREEQEERNCAGEDGLAGGVNTGLNHSCMMDLSGEWKDKKDAERQVLIAALLEGFHSFGKVDQVLQLNVAGDSLLMVERLVSKNPVWQGIWQRRDSVQQLAGRTGLILRSPRPQRKKKHSSTSLSVT